MTDRPKAAAWPIGQDQRHRQSSVPSQLHKLLPLWRRNPDVKTQITFVTPGFYQSAIGGQCTPRNFASGEVSGKSEFLIFRSPRRATEARAFVAALDTVPATTLTNSESARGLPLAINRTAETHRHSGKFFPASISKQI